MGETRGDYNGRSSIRAEGKNQSDSNWALGVVNVAATLEALAVAKGDHMTMSYKTQKSPPSRCKGRKRF